MGFFVVIVVSITLFHNHPQIASKHFRIFFLSPFGSNLNGLWRCCSQWWKCHRNLFLLCNFCQKSLHIGKLKPTPVVMVEFSGRLTVCSVLFLSDSSSHVRQMRQIKDFVAQNPIVPWPCHPQVLWGERETCNEIALVFCINISREGLKQGEFSTKSRYQQS